jgi:hypothetical protein
MTLDFRALAQSLDLSKYPRTPHLEGSRLQEGDEGYDHIPYRTLTGAYIVVEEKLDGANCGISFSEGGELLLQSRGHYLVGGGRERQFNILKAWACAHENWLMERLEDRYVMYGECMSKKHSVWYDFLGHHFLEFDVLDRKRGIYLSTAARAELLAGGPVLSVPVLYSGIAPKKLVDLLWNLGPSVAKTRRWKKRFEETVTREQLDVKAAWKHSDDSTYAEGLYIKVEQDGETVGRYKWVRADFVQTIIDSNMHHSEQPFIPNLLAPGVDIYAPQLTHDWESLKTLKRQLDGYA